MIIDNDFDKAVKAASPIWASLPGAPYGQPTGTITQVTNDYNKFLKEELEEKSDLHLKEGFLKEFGYACCGDKSNKSKIIKKRYNIEKAVRYISSHAEEHSLGACAKYVRMAIEAGGLSIEGRPIAARLYINFLPKLGFSVVPADSYSPVKGDIVVIQNIEGHPYGHIAMYNGEQWVSDFKQKDFWPGLAYSIVQPNYTIFRWQ